MPFKTLHKSLPIYFLDYQQCPKCSETVFASEGAELMTSIVRYRWVCDLCDHEFTTETVLNRDMAD
jgi:ribosomal protein S27AE